MWWKRFRGNRKTNGRRVTRIGRWVSVYIIPILGIAVLAGLCMLLWMQRITKTDYHPVENANREGTTESTVSRYEINYNFYLDGSPSMSGFFGANQNAMTLLADALRIVNRDFDNTAFYWCTDKPERIESANGFYNSMQNLSGENTWYLETVKGAFVNNGTETENQETEEEQKDRLKKEFEKLNLSSLFYSRGDGYNRFQNDAFNLIISDLNFYIEEDDTDRQTQLMREFSGYMAQYGADANLCIYCFYTTFQGESLDGRELNDDAASESQTRPFFLIMLSENDEAYFQYRDALEQEFDRLGIDYTEKLELLNDPVLHPEEFRVETEYYKERGWIVKKNLNYDSKRFEGMAENGMGLCLVRANEEEGDAELEMPVSLLELSGYSDMQEEDDETEIEVRPRIVYPKGAEYEEYSGTNIVRYAKSWLKKYDDQWYVHLKLTLNPQETPSGSKGLLPGLRTPYYIADLGFYMKRPSYSLPSWLSGMPQDRTEGILEMCEAIIASKESAFEAEHRDGSYLGNLVLYIHY